MARGFVVVCAAALLFAIVWLQPTRRRLTAGVTPNRNKWPFAPSKWASSDDLLADTRGPHFVADEHTPMREHARHDEMHRAWFKWGRYSSYPGTGLRGVDEWQMTMGGRAKWRGIRDPPGLGPPKSVPTLVNVGQVSSPRVQELLQFSEDGSPIWSEDVWIEHKTRLDANLTLSPPHYPYSAEDLHTAFESFAPAALKQADAQWAVWSSISPWVESTLFAWGARSATTVDYNVPLSAEHPAGWTDRTLRTLNQSALEYLYARHAAATHGRDGGMFDAIVSFSGVEHDGLGRCECARLPPRANFSAAVACALTLSALSRVNTQTAIRSTRLATSPLSARCTSRCGAAGCCSLPCPSHMRTTSCFRSIAFTGPSDCRSCCTATSFSDVSGTDKSSKARSIPPTCIHRCTKIQAHSIPRSTNLCSFCDALTDRQRTRDRQEEPEHTLPLPRGLPGGLARNDGVDACAA